MEWACSGGAASGQGDGEWDGARMPVCNFNELEMICAGNWPPVDYINPLVSGGVDAAVPTQQDTITGHGRRSGLPRPLPVAISAHRRCWVQFTVKNMTISTLTLEIMLSSSLCILCILAPDT